MDQCEQFLGTCFDAVGLTAYRVGGAFSENPHATWRWAFYINLCIGGVFAPIYIFFLPRGDPQEYSNVKQKLLQIDYLGMLLNVGAFTALIMAINFGGNLYDWSAAQEIALWVVGGFLLLMFVLQQAFAIGTTDSERVFPADFLRRPIMWLLFALMCAASTCVFVSSHRVSRCCQYTDVADSHLLHPSVFPIRAWRLAIDGCSETAAFYCSDGGRWFLEWWLDVETGLLHALVLGWGNTDDRRWCIDG